MQFGIDENNNRIKPTFSGQRAFCPLCNGTIIGKCGDIYIWHWQHKYDLECDPWIEHETKWHRDWKSKFPEDCREVIIEKNDEKHIADVRNSKGIVIEFQNSPISTRSIEIREVFYDKMIWVINAEKFKENFKISSAVNSLIRNLDDEFSFDYKSVKQNLSSSLTSINRNMDKISNNKEEKDTALNYNNKKLEKLNEGKINLSDLIQSIKKAVKERYYNEILSILGYEIKDKIEHHLNEIAKIEISIKDKEKYLNRIDKLESYEIGGKEYKIVEYKNISEKNIKNTIAILKTTRKSLFPEISSFKNETEFRYLSYKTKYDFAIDFTETIEKYNTEIERNKNDIDKINNIINSIITDNLTLRITSLEKEIETLKIEFENLSAEYDELCDEFEKTNKEIDEETKKYEAEAKKEYQDRKFKIMKNYKGLYHFHWKHERKTWLVSEKNVFFDIGEDYLFQRVDENTLKKISILDFLKIYN